MSESARNYRLVKIVALTFALLPLGVFQAFAQTSGCGIVSYSSPSTPGYEQGGGPSGFNVGDLPDEDEVSDPALPTVILPEEASDSNSNSIAYGPCIYTETIDKATSTYDVDDSGNLHREPQQ